MNFKLFLFVLFLSFGTTLNSAIAACLNYTSQLSIYSSYTALTPLTSTTTIDNGGNMHCKVVSTKYYYDTTNHVYRRIDSCSTCLSSYPTKLTNTAAVGSCTAEYTICSACTVTTSTPSGTSAGTVSLNDCQTAGETKYLYSSGAASYIRVPTCSTCKSGYHPITKRVSLVNCSLSYQDCTSCSPGSYFDITKTDDTNRCTACAAGTYSTTGDATSCTTCPSASDPAQYTNSNRTTIASVSSGNIKNVSGERNSVDTCYLTSGTYYDAMGTYTTVACNYDNTQHTTVGGVDCSVVKAVCTNAAGITDTVYTTGAPLGTQGAGQACWCGYGSGSYSGAATWLWTATMGPSVNGSTGSCSSSCTTSFCVSSTTLTATRREMLKCE